MVCMAQSLDLSLAPLLPVKYFVNPLTNISSRRVRRSPVLQSEFQLQSKSIPNGFNT